MKIVSDIATAIYLRFLTLDLTDDYTVVNVFRPVAKLSVLTERPQISVVPRRGTMERLTRSSRLLESFIDIGIQSKIRVGATETGESEHDDFVALLQAVDDIADILFADANSVLLSGTASLESAEVTLMQVREVEQGRVAEAVLTAKYISERSDS